MTRTLVLAAAAMLALPGAALAQAAAPTPAPVPTPAPPYGTPVGLQKAAALLDRAVVEATKRGFRMAIAVVEPSGELVAFAKMDDTQYGSTHVAQRKAWTAARYRLATSVIEQRTQAGRIVQLGNQDALPVGGGVPILVDGKIIGAIGVSGGTPAEDEAIARAALEGG